MEGWGQKLEPLEMLCLGSQNVWSSDTMFRDTSEPHFRLSLRHSVTPFPKPGKPPTATMYLSQVKVHNCLSTSLTTSFGQERPGP